MNNKRLLSMALVFALVFTLAIPATAFAATSFSDTRGHWAETYINKAVSEGIVNGYPDGKFKPDAAVSRAEFINMINKALGNTGSASVSFKDVPSFEWYYQAVAKAVSAAYTGGYDDGTFKPDAKISRQEAAVMIARFVPTYGNATSLSKFKDSSQIADWASASLSRVSGKGYIGAYDDGKLHPTDSLTRAQTAKIITDIIGKESIVTSSTTLSKDGASLSGKIYSNGVTISKDLDDGEATISNCVVLGTLTVQGGDDSGSIVIQNSRVANATVARSSDPVGLVLKGETTVNTLNAEKTATIETSSLAGGDFGAGAKTLNVAGSSDITLKGTFPKVNIDGREAELTLESGTITDLNVTTSAKESIINVESKTTVTNATVNAQSSFYGDGTVRAMSVQANNVTYEKKPSSLTVGSGVSVKPVQADSTSAKFYPANGATDVKDSVSPTITFKGAIETDDGDDVTSSYLEKNIVFKKGSSKGTDVEFSAKIDSDDEVITINPEEDLEDGKYYLGFAKNVFQDYDSSEAIAAASVTWNVGKGGTDDSVTFKPDDGDTRVSATVKPTLTFDEAIETYSGKAITKSLLDDIIDDNDLYLRKDGSSSSSNILDDGDASIDSKKKVITISPGTLDNGKYILGFKSSTFRTVEDSDKIAASSVTFTVGTASATASISPKTNVATGANVTLTFSEKVYNSSGKTVDNDYLKTAITVSDGNNATKSISGAKTVTIYPPSGGWTAGKTYTITIGGSKFKNADGVYVSSASYTFTTVTAASSLSTLTVNGINALSSKSATVPYGTEKVTITAAAGGSTAIVITKSGGLSANGNGSASGQFDLNTGYGTSTMFTITVGGTSWGTLTVTKAGPDTTVLSSAISAANAAMDGVITAMSSETVAIGQRWVTSSVKTALTNAITAATTKKNLSTATTEEIAAATTTLTSATKTFTDSIQYGTMAALDKSALVSLINTSKNLKTGIKESSTDGAEWEASQQWVTPGVMSTFESAISAAETTLNSATTQSAIDTAVTDLTGAKGTFQSAIKPGTKS